VTLYDPRVNAYDVIVRLERSWIESDLFNVKAGGLMVIVLTHAANDR